ncbi:MAG: hypothetical protein V3U80_06165 [Flavobacteriaceae bacterium]
MKKLIIIILLFSVFSCTTDTKSLSNVEVAKRYMEAIVKLDYKTAKKYASKEEFNSKKMGIDFLNFKGIDDYEFKMIKDSINGNISWIEYEDFISSKPVSMKLEKDSERGWIVVPRKDNEKSFFVKHIKFPTRKPVK